MTKPNVLLVVLDSVRARNVGLYNYHRETTPFLTSYGEQATVYHQARSPGIHSVASHASLWTGAHVEEHQIKQHEDELLPNTTVWETLADKGYKTGIFTTNPVVAHASNLADVFEDRVTDSFVDNKTKLFPDAHSPADIAKHEGVAGNLKRCFSDDRPIQSLVNSAQHFYKKQQGNLADSVTSPKLVDQFLEWERDSDRPWAACINLMDAHFPYEPADEFDNWGGDRLADIHSAFDKPPANEFIQGRPWWQLQAFEHLYDGTIREIDSYVERIINGLKEHGIHDETLVVVTSDHGEGFGELSRITGRTRLVDHSWGIHEHLTHVPLVVKYPNQTAGDDIEAPASLVQFPETVRDVIEGSAERDSFVPDRPVVASTDRLLDADALIFDGSEERADDYYGPWKAVYEQHDNSVYKYGQRGNESIVVEVQNAQRSCPRSRDGEETVQSVFGSLEPKELKKSESGEVSGEVEDRLTELGYLR